MRTCPAKKTVEHGSLEANVASLTEPLLQEDQHLGRRSQQLHGGNSGHVVRLCRCTSTFPIWVLLVFLRIREPFRTFLSVYMNEQYKAIELSSYGHGYK